MLIATGLIFAIILIDVCYLHKSGGLVSWFKKMKNVICCTEDKIGYRSPATNEGEWHSAFVAVRKGGRIYSAVFENGRDFVTGDVDWEDIMKAVGMLKKKGWIPMTKKDMSLTAGI